MKYPDGGVDLNMNDILDGEQLPENQMMSWFASISLSTTRSSIRSFKTQIVNAYLHSTSFWLLIRSLTSYLQTQVTVVPATCKGEGF
jgi:hypothetical protein